MFTDFNNRVMFLDTLLDMNRKITGAIIDSAKKKSQMHTYVITYEDYRGEVFEDDFETDVDTIEEAKELYLDEDRDICILDIEKIN